MNIDAGRAAGDLEPPAPTSKSPGELLREERIRRKLSVQQAAEDLHLDVRSIEALESNNFQALGPPVYAKGHLRKYAVLLGLAPDLIIARYQALSDVPTVPAPIPVTAALQPHRRRSLRVPALRMPTLRVPSFRWRVAWPWVLGAVAVVAVGLGIWGLVAWYAYERASAAAAAAAMAANQAVEPVVPPPAAAQRDPDRVIVWFEFTDASWIEVYDATGARLSYDIAQGGQLRKIAGKAPLKVALGAASAVKMRVNDQSVAIPRQTGRGATRFQIAADGSVR